MGAVIGRPVAAQSGNVAAAVATATLPAAPNRKTYIGGFECTGAGSTAGVAVNVTVSGLDPAVVVGGTLTYVFTAPVGVLVPAPPLTVWFDPPLPASAVNATIVVSMPSLGAGNTNASVVAHGFTIES